MLALHTAIGVIEIVLHALSVIIVVQAILSILIAFNVVNRYNQFVSGLESGLDQLTRPLYRPLRRIIPTTGAMDWSPFFALILIQILLYVLGNADVAVLTSGAGV